MVTAFVTLIVGLVTLVAYSAGVRRVRRFGGTWPASREVSIVAGVLTCSVAVLVPFGDRFSGHVLEHVVLGMVGPFLVAASAPLTLLSRAAPRPARPHVRRLLRSRPTALVTHPVFATAVAVLAPWLLWLTPLNDWQREHASVHALVHIHLVVSGVLFGVAILGLDLTPWRRRHAVRLFAAALALPVHTILGLVVLSAAHPYLNPGMAPGDGLADQRFGAALLWLTGDGLATVVILVIVAQWFEAERRASSLTAREPGATPSRRGAPSVPNRPAAGSAPRG